MTLKEYYLQQKAIFQPVLDAPQPDYLVIKNVSEQQLGDMLDVCGEALGPEKVHGIINAPIRPHSMSPDYKESKVCRPHEAEIQDLRDKYTHTADAAKNAENEKLLQKVSAALQDVKPEILSACHGPRSNVSANGIPISIRPSTGARTCSGFRAH